MPAARGGSGPLFASFGSARFFTGDDVTRTRSLWRGGPAVAPEHGGWGGSCASPQPHGSPLRRARARCRRERALSGPGVAALCHAGTRRIRRVGFPVCRGRRAECTTADRERTGVNRRSSSATPRVVWAAAELRSWSPQCQLVAPTGSLIAAQWCYSGDSGGMSPPVWGERRRPPVGTFRTRAVGALPREDEEGAGGAREWFEA